MISDLWENVQKNLREVFKLNDARIVWVGEIRDELRRLASGGISIAPDFTLHNEVHSDNLVLILGQLVTQFDIKLSDYEAYLLTRLLR